MSAPPPLIILTCMRSYSSLVCGMLGQHPDLVALPEINPFLAEDVGHMMRLLKAVRPRSLDGILRVIAEVEFGGQTRETVERAQGWLETRRGWSQRRLLDHLSEALAPARWIDKSPSTVVTDNGIRLLGRILPESPILHLVRHPLPTGLSIHKLTGQTPSRRRGASRDPEESWLRANRAAVEVGAALPPGQYLQVRGEDILTEPDRYLPQILEWLGLPWDEVILADMRHPERSPFACLGPANAPFGNDPGFLRHPHYTPRPIPPVRLSDPAPWRDDGTGLGAETMELARRLGYP